MSELPYDMDVVINGRRFVAEDKVREHIDGIVAAATADLEVEVERLQFDLGQAHGNLEAIREISGRGYARMDAADATWTAVGGETIQLVTETGKVIDFSGANIEVTLDPEDIRREVDVFAGRTPADPDPYDSPEFHEDLPVSGGGEPRKRGWFRKALAGFWLIIIGAVAGSAATLYNPDTPTLVETRTVVVGNDDSVEVPAEMTMTLTWPGIEGATYDVQIWQGGRLVQQFQTDVTRANVTLPQGSYQWVVYPVTNGENGQAIVNSVLVVR
jgi:hypothetical protein